MMKDGLYQVTTYYLCAGFVINNGQIVHCAPILRKNIDAWIKVAKLVVSGDVEFEAEDK